MSQEAMKRILVPTDFSLCAENAAKIAIEIAAKNKCEIDFLHFTSIPIDWVNIESAQDKMYLDVTKKVNECKAELAKLAKKAVAGGVLSRSFVGYNESYQCIIDHVLQNDIDLIVMGSHGASGFREFIGGSNTQKVIRFSKTPVLVIKENTKHMIADKLVIVSNFEYSIDSNENATERSIVKLFQLAEDLGLEIDLLYINTPDAFETSKVIKDRMDHLENKYHIQVKSKNIVNAETFENGLRDYLEEHTNTIVGMMTHGYRGLNRWFLGSLVEDVANHLESPMISVKMD